MSEYLIYDTDDGGWQGTQQTFVISSPNEAVFLKSAGLTEDVNVYQMVGVCQQCAPSDVKWEMVYRDGVPLTLGPDNNGEWVTEPGKYSLGDPTNPPEFSGDVNISAEKFKGVDASSLGKSSPTESNPLPTIVVEDVTIDSSCEEPVYVEVCNNQTPIETSMAQLGCIEDEDGRVIGKVMLVKITDEQTQEEIVRQVAYYEDGTVTDPYSGEWVICNELHATAVHTKNLCKADGSVWELIIRDFSNGTKQYQYYEVYTSSGVFNPANRVYTLTVDSLTNDYISQDGSPLAIVGLGECPECINIPFMGVITDLNLLSN